ncbi:MAG: hypothetical protein JXR95_05285 [Deltaproteobacteria bacterium]|nr:hypothetical protein [Deltaproteobacteria bacterium]
MKHSVANPVDYTIFLDGPFGPLPLFIRELTRNFVVITLSPRVKNGDIINLKWKSMGCVLHETIGSVCETDEKSRTMKILFIPRNKNFENWIDQCAKKGMMEGFAPPEKTPFEQYIKWSDGLFWNISIQNEKIR